MLKKILTMLLGLFIMGASSVVYAQNGTLTGTVTDAETGDPLPGANVYIEELETGTSVGAEGTYEITGVEPGTYNVRVTYVGYSELTEEVEITSGDNNFDIEMESDAAELDEVVVTGYGEYSERNFTGSVSQVGSDDFEGSPVSSFEQSLEGSVAGANFSAATGTPGAVQEVRIRGISSINAGSDPLYVIDGVPVESGSRATSTATSSLGILSSLNPDDIESVSVLKDAASTAPYGARGSNGVIVIETKSGQEGDVTYSVDTQRGWSNRAVDGPGTISAEEYDRYRVDAENNAGEDYDYGRYWDEGSGTNWSDVVTNDNAVTQKYTLSARGGNEQTQFYASTSMFGQEGAYIGADLDRLSGKININHELSDRVTLSNNFSGSFVEQDGSLEGAGYFASPVRAEYAALPTDPAYNEDGSPNTDLSNTTYNPAYVEQYHIDRKRNNRVLNNTELDVQIMENMSFNTNLSLDYVLTEEKYYNDANYGDGQDVGGDVNDIINRDLNYVWKNNLSYIYQPTEESTFDIQLLSESQKNHAYYLDALGEGVAYEELYNLNTTASPQGASGSTTDWAIQSFTGLVNYNFNDKIIADASLRREGSSRFSDDQRWGNFWSLGAGYIFSEDDYIQDIEWIDFLKLRASYGVTGNADIDLNSYQTLVGFSSYNGNSNIQLDQLGNEGLTWEKANSLDLSLEFETFERLDGSVTLFRKDTRDMLFDQPLSRTTGHTSQIINGGELYNQGVEIELDANLINAENFNWDLGGNFSLIKNEVTELPKDLNGDPIETTTGTRYVGVEGYENNAWFMREWAGVDSENGDPLWYMDDGDGGRTTTNDYNEADEYYQGGNAQPTESGAINTRIDVFGFYAKADVSFAFGHKIFDNWSNYYLSDGAFLDRGQYATQMDYWTSENTDASNPRPVAGGNNNSNETSSRSLYDGDHVRLKSLNVGYNIPAKYLENIGLRSANIYMNGRNLFTHVFDEDLKFDPEQKASGFTSLSSQPMRSFTVGIKANF